MSGHNSHFDILPPAARLIGREILSVDKETGEIRLRFLARPDFVNRHGTVQGGMLAAMLDSATSCAIFDRLPPNTTSLTMRLETEFLKPVPAGEILAVARLTHMEGRDARASAEILAPDGTPAVRANAAFRVLARKA